MNRTFSIAFWTLCPGILLGLIAATCALSVQPEKTTTTRSFAPVVTKPTKAQKFAQTSKQSAGKSAPRKKSPASSRIRQVSAEKMQPAQQTASTAVETDLHRPVFFQVVKEQQSAPPTAAELQIQQLQAQMQQLLAQKNDAASLQAHQMERLAQQLQQQQLNQMELRLDSIQSAIRQSGEPPVAIQRGTGLGNGTVVQTNPALETPLPPPVPHPTLPGSTSPEMPIPESVRERIRPEKQPAIVKDGETKDGEERFSLQIRDTEIVQVLDMLGEIAHANIIPGPSVQGKVTVNLTQVTLSEALQAILRSTGLVFEREGNLYYVSTPEEQIARTREERRLLTKVYRPQYISVQDLQILLTPLLSQPLGKIAVTMSPDGMNGMGAMGASAGTGQSSNGNTSLSSSTSSSSSGGISGNMQNGSNRLAQQDALLVRDFPEVLAQFDQIVAEMDVPPQQVHIEAMILSVKLDDQMALGVNFALVNGKDNQLVVSGNGAVLGASSGLPGQDGATIVPQNPFSEFLADAAGLKYGFIRGDVSAFISALQNITDTNLIATPQLMVLNKQKAQLIIGDRLSYSTSTFQNNQSIQNVNFVDAGTKLSIRPFVARDGLVRMEIHPERSSAVINRITGLPDIATTEVTSNVMVRDGTTIVIGGLIEEQVHESQERVPLLGALPLVGMAFRNKNEQTERRELIILITPRIVQEAEAVNEGDAAKYENERRAQHFQDELAPANRRNLTRLHYNRALLHYERGELQRAKQHVQEAARQNKHDRQVLRLEERINAALREQRQTWMPWTAEEEAQAAEEAVPVEEVVPEELESLPMEATPPAIAPPPPEPLETTKRERSKGLLRWSKRETLAGN